MNYKLSCIESNDRHTTFYMFDRGERVTTNPTPANCGKIIILTDDLTHFLQCWKGDIDWNMCTPGRSKS